MARHSSFKNLVAYETYQRFLATVRARSLAHQDPTWELESGWGTPGASQLSGGTNEPGLPFSSAEGLPTGQPKLESWIESWLSGKISKPRMGHPTKGTK